MLVHVLTGLIDNCLSDAAGTPTLLTSLISVKRGIDAALLRRPHVRTTILASLISGRSWDVLSHLNRVELLSNHDLLHVERLRQIRRHDLLLDALIGDDLSVVQKLCAWE